jgi:hypothetical protein
MSDRLDELKGEVKKGLGGLTGDKRLQGDGGWPVPRRHLRLTVARA